MSINTDSISAGQALEVLKTGWALQQKGIFLSYMMHGRPGIGKTQLGEALAKFINGKLYDLRLTTIEPSDLRGMPHYDHERKLTVWYRPEDLPQGDEPAVLFFDELTAASPFLQPTVYGILQERRIGQHKIPDNVIIVAAGNTIDDGAVAFEMGTAISDRLIHMLVEADAKDWVRNYAVRKSLHPAVIAFINTHPDYFETTKDAIDKQDMIACTPRSWERVSNIMYNVTDEQVRHIMVSGTVGQAAAANFAIVANDVAATVKIFDMIDAPRNKRAALYPQSFHGLNAMAYALLAAAEPSNVVQIIEIIADLGELVNLRPDEPKFRQYPLKELQTHTFEMLFDDIVKNRELLPIVLKNETYRAYRNERKAQGLE